MEKSFVTKAYTKQIAEIKVVKKVQYAAFLELCYICILFNFIPIIDPKIE